jgi:hypothetical protein
MKVIVIVAAVVVIGAVGAGVIAWSSSGSSAHCDQDQLVAAMREAMDEAERGSQVQMPVRMPDACTDDDMAAAMPGVSRSWHPMPGGVMMREQQHMPQ